MALLATIFHDPQCNGRHTAEVWYIAMLVMYIIVDVLRLTGTTHAALYVHLMPPQGLLPA